MDIFRIFVTDFQRNLPDGGEAWLFSGGILPCGGQIRKGAPQKKERQQGEENQNILQSLNFLTAFP